MPKPEIEVKRGVLRITQEGEYNRIYMDKIQKLGFDDAGLQNFMETLMLFVEKKANKQ